MSTVLMVGISGFKKSIAAGKRTPAFDHCIRPRIIPDWVIFRLRYVRLLHHNETGGFLVAGMTKTIDCARKRAIDFVLRYEAGLSALNGETGLARIIAGTLEAGITQLMERVLAT